MSDGKAIPLDERDSKTFSQRRCRALSSVGSGDSDDLLLRAQRDLSTTDDRARQEAPERLLIAGSSIAIGLYLVEAHSAHERRKGCAGLGEGAQGVEENRLFVGHGIFLSASHAARCVACQAVRSHPVPVALVIECSIPLV